MRQRSIYDASMTHKHRAVHSAMYGNIAMKRAYCSSCRTYAFVRDGKMACCGEVLEGAEIKGCKRMSEPPNVRDRPSRKEQKRILSDQHHRCFYCSRWFGTEIWRKARRSNLRVHWDHVIPWVYSLDNRNQNFVAACHVCNMLKGAKMFNSIEEARIYLNARWEEKGFTTKAPVCEVSDVVQASP